MDRIGVFICNYNKKQYILDNLYSFSQQTLRDRLDIYVIDNASTDGAPDAIEMQYPYVKVVRNEKNLGGAGGFCQALKMGEEIGYEFILLADNDVRLAADAVESLHKFLVEHTGVGMAGAKIYLMDDPKRIWIYGNWIDFDKYKMVDGYANELDSEEQPDVVYCDTVPSCCSMIRTKCLKETGYMPESNFISWDDIEWCYRFGLAGYKVAAISAAKVWHKTGGSVLTNHFSTYYYNRNRLHFFAKYVDRNRIDDFAEKVLTDYFTRIYGLAQKGSVNHVVSLMYALTDFLSLIRGKAEDNKILPYDRVENQLSMVVQDFSCVIIKCPCNLECGDEEAMCHALNNVLWTLKDKKKAVVMFEGEDRAAAHLKERYKGNYEIPYVEAKHMIPEGIKVNLCNHVRYVESYEEAEIYVDEWGNVIKNRGDFYYFRNFESAKRNFMMMYYRLFLDTVIRIGGN